MNWVGNTVQIIFGGRCNDVYDELEKIIFSKEFTSLTKEYKDKILETLKALIK